MSLRLEMLQVARLAPKLLGDSAELVRDFLLRQQNSDGGFKDRSGRSDLYYTVFALDALSALEVQGSKSNVQSSTVPVWMTNASKFVGALGDGRHLDFVHLCCLARAQAGGATFLSTQGSGNAGVAAPLRHIETFRSRDGGYNPTASSETGTVYGCFLALGAYQDMGATMPNSSRLLDCLHALETADGAWSNAAAPASSSLHPPSIGSTNATAAAIAVLRQLESPVPPRAADWLLARCHPQGGFLAAPDAPIPDLLSTATSLHALASMGVPLDGVRERCLDYIDSLWTNAGSFHGHWAEDILDCEYTFYGLLALGHLSW